MTFPLLFLTIPLSSSYAIALDLNDYFPLMLDHHKKTTLKNQAPGKRKVALSEKQ